MKFFFIKLLSSARMESVAPISGGGVGIVAWATEMAPLISIAAATVGAALGIASYLLKRKKTKMEIELLSAKIKQTKKD